MDIQNIDWNNKEEVLKVIKEDGLYLVYVSQELKKDQEVVLEAIKNNSEAIREVDASLLGDKEFMTKALEYSVNAKNYHLGANPLIYASKELQQDKEFVLDVVRKKGEALQYADYFKQDKEVVLEAIRNNAFALGYADELAKSDKEIVLEAVNKNGWVLSCASEELKNDKEVVMAAAQQIRESIDKSIANGEIENPEFYLYDIGEELQQDEVFMKKIEKIMEGQAELEYDQMTSNDIKNKIEELIEDSKKYVYPEKMEQWKNCLVDMMENRYSAGVVTDIMEMLPVIESSDNLDAAKELLAAQNHSGMTETMLRNAVLNFSKKGPEFYEYTASEELTLQEVEIVEIIRKENLILEEKYKSEKTTDEDIVSATVGQHTAEEIAEGINPSMEEIDAVTKEMIEEQTLEKSKEDKTIE